MLIVFLIISTEVRQCSREKIYQGFMWHMKEVSSCPWSWTMFPRSTCVSCFNHIEIKFAFLVLFSISVSCKTSFPSQKQTECFQSDVLKSALENIFSLCVVYLFIFWDCRGDAIKEKFSKVTDAPLRTCHNIFITFSLQLFDQLEG